MRILGLDTSGKTASAAILDTEKNILLGEHTVYTSRTHSQVIMPMCKNLLSECNMTVRDVDCFAVAVGPGSYTGLRIGIAAVQGMAMVNNTPCIGVSTLEAMANRIFGAKHILSVIHARGDLFYVAWFSYQIYMYYDPTYIDREIPDELQTFDEIAKVTEHIINDSEPIIVTGEGAEEFIRQYKAAHKDMDETFLRIAPPFLRMQSAAGICHSAANYCASHKELPSASDLTASYLQAVQIQKKKTDK
ncbi:MAG: tRNA (adenosine(37)-N6)-threonylcarbamoyltransferase complex dimerization subunit type 1 TsaB [Oscillospiraceae bacterium]|nr:tRNA (adenosine(37)-N6)-threonylcarbamoyltransferase complex dimerization subunit type 1 TsaB [Oscillospiraceae bacterium]